VVLGSLLAAVASVSYVPDGVGADAGAMIPAEEIVFVPLMEGSPILVAKLWGERGQGEYGMLIKVPAGFEAGLHAHTGDYHGINLQGTWVHTMDGQTKELPVGSYVMQPGMKNHNDVCKGPGDCIWFIHQRAKGDFIPAKPQ
jgi:hypothetical protein